MNIDLDVSASNPTTPARPKTPMRTLTFRQVWQHARNVGYPRTASGWWQAVRDLLDATPGATALIDCGTGRWSRQHPS